MKSLVKVFYPTLHINHIISYDHPERPNRVIRSVEFLREEGYIVEGVDELATIEDVTLVHKKEYVLDTLKREGLYLDPDTPVKRNTLDVALNSVRVALECAKASKKGYLCLGLNRPPGHHAGYNFGGGFCYLNNIAIATFREFYYSKVLILDLDVHHGNGTQDIVERFSEGNIMYLSLHQKDIFPLTGYKHERFSLNFPLEAGTESSKYLKELKLALALAESRLKEIEVLAISMGFDAYLDDPLANLYLNTEDYYKIGKVVGSLAREHSSKVFVTLEGGYSYELPLLIYNFMQGLEEELHK
jgi:acetoin utilization deacetylase AcuC-like enzyme